MTESILTSIKKLLGIVEEYENFDSDIIMHINSVFMTLNQLGVGPTNCFRIQDKTAVWIDFAGSNTDIEAIKTYIYLKVKIVFDPPTNGTVMEANKQMINELEWRLNVQAESK